MKTQRDREKALWNMLYGHLLASTMEELFATEDVSEWTDKDEQRAQKAVTKVLESIGSRM